MTSVKRILRLLRFLVLATLALAVGAVAVFTLTAKGRDNLAALISTMASSEGSKVRIGGLGGIWAGPLTLDHVVLEDVDGAWLVARGIEVDWSPLALLSFTFEADRILAKRLEVARLPKASGKAGGGAGLPVSLAIRRIELPDVALGEQIAGGVAQLSANGTLDVLAAPLNIKTDLRIVRTDGVGGDLDASVHFVPSEKQLDVAVRGSEPAGGILANLLKLPGAPPVDILVSGSGPAEDWKGSGTFAVDGAVVTTLSGNHSFVDGGSRIEVKGDGEFERFLPSSLRPLLAGKATFDIAGLLGAAGRIDVERADLQSAAIRASAHGAVDPQGASDLAVQAETVAGPVVLAFGADAATVSLNRASARVFGAGNEPMVDVAASLDRMTVQGNVFRNVEATLHSDGFDVTGATGPVAIELTAEALALDNAALAPLVAGPVRAGVQAVVSEKTIRIDSGSVTSEALSASLSGDIRRPDLALSMTVEADAAASALPEAARARLGERVALSGTIKRDAAGVVSAELARLVSGDLVADGRATLDGERIDAALKGTFADVGRFAEGMAGAIGFAVEARGDAKTPDVSLTVTSDRIEAAGRAVTGLELTAAGRADLARPAADVSLKGMFAGEALTGTAALKTTDGRREINGLSIALGQNRIAGDLVLDAAFVPEGALAFSVPDVASLAALAEQEAEGLVEGTVRLSSKNGIPEIVIDATSPSLSRADLAATNVAVGATVTDYLGVAAISGKARAASVVSGAIAARDVDVTLGRSADRLEVTLRGSEPEGGALAKALGLPGSPVFDIAVSGSGPVADWRGGGTVAIDGSLVTTLSATHKLVDGGRRITVKGDGTFERFLPEPLRPLLAGKADVDFAGLLATAGGIDVEHAIIRSSAIRASATGSVGPQGTSDLVLQAQAAADPVPLSVGQGPQAVALALKQATARLSGPADKTRLEVAASFGSVVAQGNALRDVDAALHSDGFDLTTGSGPVSLDLTAGAVAPDNAMLAPLLAGPVTAVARADISGEAIAIASASLSSAALDARLAGTISRPDFALAMTVEADAASSALPAAVRTALAERVGLTGTIRRDAGGVLSADSLKLASGDLAVDGSATLKTDSIEASLKGAFADIGRLAEGASGAVRFSLAATGRRDAPDLAFTVTSDAIRAAGREISGLELTASGAADLANPSASVSLKGNVAGEALTGTAVLKTTDGRREINGLSILLGRNRITGDLVLDENFVPEGTVDFSVPDIGPLAALALDAAKGDVTGKIRFSRPNGVPQIVVDATTASLSRGDLAARDVAVAATVADYLGTPAISGKLRAASVVSGATVVTDVDVTLTRDGIWTGFSGGATVNAMPAKAAGRFRVENGETTIELASGEATVNGIKVVLAKATTVAIKGGETVLDRLALAISGGSVVISGTAGTTLALDVQLGAIPAAAANTFSSGLNATGTVAGSARVSGAASQPQIGYTIRWTNAGTAQTSAAGFGAMAISSSGTFSGGTLKFDADIGDGTGLGIKGGGTIGTAGTPTLSLDFSGKVPFAFLTRHLAAQGLSLSGGADVALQIRGPATAPAISGTVRSSGARFVDSNSGIAINGIDADVSLGSGVATLRSLSGTLSTGGSLSARGSVGIDVARGFPADLSLKIVDGRYTDGRVVTTTVGGDLVLKGPLVDMPLLSGTLNLGRTVITVPERLPASLSTLDVQHRNAPKPVIAQKQAIRPAEAGSTGGSGRIRLDLTINAPQQIFVQGRGLDAELGGSLKLNGMSDAPQASGQFTMRRGRLSLLGKRLTFSRGTLGFSGSLIPNLDLAADSTARDATVTVAVTGPAINPRFSFSSVPALPQDEVLARLIFGRSMSGLSALQIAQLADAAAQLAGIGGPTSLLENLRGKIGIDDLDVKTDDQGNAAVSAGKYLNDRTYVTIEKGEKAGSGKATIDLDVGRGVRLRGQASEDGSARGGVFFEREY